MSSSNNNNNNQPPGKSNSAHHTRTTHSSSATPALRGAATTTTAAIDGVTRARAETDAALLEKKLQGKLVHDVADHPLDDKTHFTFTQITNDDVTFVAPRQSNNADRDTLVQHLKELRAQ